jgi:hypothetical protein
LDGHNFWNAIIFTHSLTHALNPGIIPFLSFFY